MDRMKEQHERAIADQLLNALQCDGKFLLTVRTTENLM